MKRKKFILASVVALAFVCAVSAVHAWMVGTSTTYSSGSWHDSESGHTLNSTSQSGSLLAEAPYHVTNCGDRYAWGYDDEGTGGRHHMGSATCPPFNPVATPECCVKQTVSLTADYYYWVEVHQYSGGAPGCGPTGGTIGSGNINCNSDSP